MGYTTAMWLGFGEALAAVAGALTGLLFVALSVKSAVATVASLLGGVVNAWLFLVKATS